MLRSFAVSVLALMVATAAPVAATEPTCSSVLDIAVHGQHIVGDYVTGTGHTDLGWPASGEVGQTVAENGGVALTGGPGPGFHFPNGFAPGASFCLSQSQAPGFHVGQ